MTNVTCGLTAKKLGSAPCSMLVIEYGTSLLYIACRTNQQQPWYTLTRAACIYFLTMNKTELVLTSMATHCQLGCSAQASAWAAMSTLCTVYRCVSRCCTQWLLKAITSLDSVVNDQLDYRCRLALGMHICFGVNRYFSDRVWLWDHTDSQICTVLLSTLSDGNILSDKKYMGIVHIPNCTCMRSFNFGHFVKFFTSHIEKNRVISQPFIHPAIHPICSFRCNKTFGHSCARRWHVLMSCTSIWWLTHDRL